MGYGVIVIMLEKKAMICSTEIEIGIPKIRIMIIASLSTDCHLKKMPGFMIKVVVIAEMN